MAWENLNTEKKVSLAHLGVTATHVRKIKSGAEYEKYFEPATGKTELINDNATVHDTLEFVAVLVNKTLNDTAKISEVLKRTTLEATCKSIFDFFYQNYQYKLDDIGVEQVRRPNRSWADRKGGIDCDCFTTSVSSVLTNLGIEHHLKIIAINGRPNFQHIYVVVPKTSGLNINTRANYWVIDPVLNSFDEEAPKITKTKHLKMNGIPLQQLNGIEDYAGLGNEFEGIDEELNGLDDESMGRAFKRRLRSHITNTRRKIQRDPKSVAQLYRPDVLLNQMQKLEAAFDGTDEQLDAVLEGLSNTEHEAIQPQFAAVYDAVHGHDDELYGHLYGSIDERMIDAVMGLGRKSAKKAAKKAAKKTGGKKGFFTKIKNAKKAIKSGKFKGKLKKVIKKVGRILKKTNPLAMAARGGFIMAMRTNFGKIAEKAYWGYQTREFAKSKGITDAFYDQCVALLTKIQKVYIDKLGGNASAIKKPIMNGRAAKKIAKSLKKKGMSGTTEELFGLGGLGVVTAAASATTITAAMAFLAPLMAFMKKAFKGKKDGTVANENGTESEASENGSEEMDTTESEARNPSNTTVDNDGSVEAADATNDEDPSDDDNSKKKVVSRMATSDGSSEDTSTDTSSNTGVKPGEGRGDGVKPGEGRGGSEEESGTDQAATGSGSKTGMVLGILGIGGIAAYMFSQSSKKKKAATVSGLGSSKKAPAKKAKKIATTSKVKTIKL